MNLGSSKFGKRRIPQIVPTTKPVDWRSGGHDWSGDCGLERSSRALQWRRSNVGRCRKGWTVWGSLVQSRLLVRSKLCIYAYSGSHLPTCLAALRYLFPLPPPLHARYFPTCVRVFWFVFLVWVGRWLTVPLNGFAFCDLGPSSRNIGKILRRIVTTIRARGTRTWGTRCTRVNKFSDFF